MNDPNIYCCVCERNVKMSRLKEHNNSTYHKTNYLNNVIYNNSKSYVITQSHPSTTPLIPDL